jgi:predicted RNA binding protein YcfA (HicA-like mRNA interferase family)
MKRRELIRLLKQNGWRSIRNKGDHEVYSNGASVVAVPRHSEVNELTAQSIVKRCKLQ